MGGGEHMSQSQGEIARIYGAAAALAALDREMEE